MASPLLLLLNAQRRARAENVSPGLQQALDDVRAAIMRAEAADRHRLAREAARRSAETRRAREGSPEIPPLRARALVGRLAARTARKERE